MIFNDIVDKFSSIDNILIELKPIYADALNLQKFSDVIIKSSIENSYLSNSSSNYSALTNTVKNILSNTLANIKNQNLFSLGKLWTRINAEVDKSLDSIIINDLLNTLDIYSSNLYNFMNAPTNSEYSKSYINLLDSVNNFIHTYSIYIKFSKELRNFHSQLETSWGMPSNENKNFTIRVYRENLTLSEMTLYNESMSKMYSILCRSFNINETECPLLPVKLESGSWYAKLKGNEFVITLMLSIMSFGYEVYSDNFSEIAKKRTQVEQANYIKEHLELVQLAQDVGIELNDDCKSKLESELTDFLTNSLNLTKCNTEINLNGKIINLVNQNELKKYITGDSRQVLDKPAEY